MILSSILVGHSYDLKTILTLVQICFGVFLAIIGGRKGNQNNDYETINFLYGLCAILFGNLATALRSVLFKIHSDYSNDTKFSLYSFYIDINFVSFCLFFPFYLTKKTFFASSPFFPLFSSSLISIKYLLIASSLNFAYNLLSFQILKQISTLTHSIMNIMKRMYVVFGSMFVLNTKLSRLQYVGIFVADTGCLMYAYLMTKKNTAINVKGRGDEKNFEEEVNKNLSFKKQTRNILTFLLVFVCLFYLSHEISYTKNFSNIYKEENRQICLNKIKAQIVETMRDVLPETKQDQKTNVFLFGVPEHLNYGDTLIW